MLLLTHLPGSLDPKSAADLFALAQQHEVVLAAPATALGANLLPALRQALPRFRIVAIATFGDLTDHERSLVKEWLDDGHLPLVLTDCPPAAGDVDWSWLGADRTIDLPA